MILKNKQPSGHLSICKLVLTCSGGCGETIPVDLPVSTEALADFLMAHHWYAVVLTPMELVNKGIMHFGPTCRTCALAYMPEIVKMVDEGRFPKASSHARTEKDLLS